MLQNIRDKSQGVVLWIVVILIIGTFALWGVHSYVTGTRNSHTPAVVNHQTISEAQVMASYERLRQQQQMQLGANFSMNSSVEDQLKHEALSHLVISTVLIQAANRAGYRVTTDQVDEALLKIPAFQENGQFSATRFHEILSSTLYSQDSFLSDMRNSMLISQVQSGYANSEFALPGEVSTAIRLVNQKRDISYAIIPAAHFEGGAQVSDANVKNYYQTHQNEFQSPEQVSLDYITLSMSHIKESLHFDEAKLQQYYENNIQNYTKPASWHVAYILVKLPQGASPGDAEGAKKKMDDIQQQLKSGAHFSALAEKYSQDPVTAKKGGEMNWFSAGTFDPAFEKAAANLKVDEVSAPVRTSFGYALIKLLGVKKAEVMPFDQVKAQVESTLAEQQAEQLFLQASDKLSNLTYSNPTTLEVAAKALDLPIQNTHHFSHNGLKEGVASNPKVIAAAFSTDVLQNGNNSDLISLSPNAVAVIRVKNHQPQTVLPFADVENTIAQKLRNQQAQQQAETVGKNLLAKIESGAATSAELSRIYPLSWQIDKEAGRYDSRVDSRILNEAFGMPYPQNNKPAIKGVKLPSGDYAIIQVNAVHQGELAKSDQGVSQNIFREELEKNYGQIDYQLYVRELMSKANIKINDAALVVKTDNE